MEDAPIRGLEGVIATDTRICDLDGVNGVLAYCGYDVPEMVRKKVTFEEIIYLLWHGELPTRERLKGFDEALKAERNLSPDMLRALKQIPPGEQRTAALRGGVGILGLFDPEAEDTSTEANRRKALQAHREDSHHRRGPAPPRGGLKTSESPQGTRTRGEFPLHDHRRGAR